MRVIVTSSASWTIPRYTEIKTKRPMQTMAPNEVYFRLSNDLIERRGIGISRVIMYIIHYAQEWRPIVPIYSVAKMKFP